MDFASLRAFEKACKVLPGGVSSPLRSFQKVERVPLIAKKAKADLLFNIEEEAYIDFCMGNGAVILGHAPLIFREIFTKFAEEGISYGTIIEEEEKLASLILSHFPSMEKIRFFPSGTESCMTAIRLARAFTAKKKIIQFSGGYHGHAEDFLVKTGEEKADTLVLPFNDTQAVLDTFLREEEIAAVILEPVCTNMGVVPATLEFLQTLRELTKSKKALLIFDEIVTGYRLGLQGAQGFYQIEPDLTCLGKIIGGGAPCGALAGKKEIMELFEPLGPVFHAGTFAANPLSIRLGLATLKELEKPQFYEDLHRKAHEFLGPIQKFLEKKQQHSLIQIGSLFSLFAGIGPPKNFEQVQKQDTLFFRRLFSFLFDKKIFLHPSYYEAQFLSIAHTKGHLDTVQGLILEFLEKDRSM